MVSAFWVVLHSCPSCFYFFVVVVVVVVGRRSACLGAKAASFIDGDPVVWFEEVAAWYSRDEGVRIFVAETSSMRTSEPQSGSGTHGLIARADPGRRVYIPGGS